jgi:hypothetical protein
MCISRSLRPNHVAEEQLLWNQQPGDVLALLLCNPLCRLVCCLFFVFSRVWQPIIVLKLQ